MYLGEKGVGALFPLKNVIYALNDEYKQKFAPQGDVGDMS